MMFVRKNGHLSLACFAIAAVGTSVAWAQDLSPIDSSKTNKIVRIAQDWRVELYSTGAFANCSPQIVTGFQLPNQERLFQITWNHVDSPAFSPGGFQVQGWQGDTLVSVDTAFGTPLSDLGTVLTWTQIVGTTGEQTGSADYYLVLANVRAGNWRQTAAVTMKGNVPNLNDYDPQLCLDNSAVVTGTNRVKWVGIIETRFYDDRGQLVKRDTESKSVFQQPSQYSYFNFKKLDGAANMLDVDSRLLESVDKAAILRSY
jgi:hypothetical protein